MSDGLFIIDSVCFMLGNIMFDVEISVDDIMIIGILDLSCLYMISMDIINVEDIEGDNNFIIYVDNNISSSSKLIYGGDVKFFSEFIILFIVG